MRGCNAGYTPEVSVPLRQQVTSAAVPYVSFARRATRKHKAVGCIGTYAVDGLGSSTPRGGLLLGPVVQVYMRLVAVLQNESKRSLRNA